MNKTLSVLLFIPLFFLSCSGKSNTSSANTTDNSMISRNTSDAKTDVTETVKMGIFNLEPFLVDMGDGEKPGGVTIDYWEQYIAPKMGVKLAISGPYPVLRLFKMLETGEIDVIPQLTKNPERDELYLYPTKPFSDIKTCLVVENDSPVKQITKQEDLFGLRIGFFEGGTVPDLLKHDSISIEFVTQADFRKVNLEKLVAKRIDAMFDLNYTSMLYDIYKMGFKDKVRTVLLPIPSINVYSIFTRSEKGEKLLKLYEKANNEVSQTGAFEELTQKYME